MDASFGTTPLAMQKAIRLMETGLVNPEEIVSVGEELDLKVISLDPEERRIGLSLKEAREDQEQTVISRYMDGQRDSDRNTLGDMMDRLNVSSARVPGPTEADQEDDLSGSVAEEIEERSDTSSEDPVEEQTEETPDEQEGDSKDS